MFTNTQIQPIVFTSQGHPTGHFIIADAELGESYVDALERQMKRQAVRIAIRNGWTLLQAAAGFLWHILRDYRLVIRESDAD